MLNLIVDLYADIRKEMNSICQDHKCIINYHLYSDDESESDISDIAESGLFTPSDSGLFTNESGVFTNESRVFHK